MKNTNFVKNTLDTIPKPKNDAKQIVGLIKDKGRVTGYRLSNNLDVTKAEAVSMAKNGDIKGVGIAHRKDNEYLKAIPNGSESDNLSSLPTVK